MHDGCKDLSFNLQIVFIFLVSQLIWHQMYYLWTGGTYKFCLVGVSFLGQNVFSNKITDLGASNRLDGVVYSSVSMMLPFYLTALMKIPINFVG